MNPPNQMTTDALLDGFIVWLGAGHSKATQQSYYDGLRRFRKWANTHKKPIKEITLTDLSRFILDLESCQLKGATRFSYVTALRSFWRWLHEQGIVSFSEKMIPLPEYEKDMRDHLLPEEFLAMMAIFDEHFPKDLRNKCILSFLYDTGLRLGEFLSIDIGAIEMDKRQCVVKTFKRKNHKRAVFWGDETHRLLIDWLDLRQAILRQGGMYTQALWTGISKQHGIGDRLEKSAVQRMFRDVRARAGITRKVSVHSCRHGLATELIKSGMSTPHVSRILGHANLNSTMIYTHLDHTDLRDAYRKYRVVGT